MLEMSSLYILPACDIMMSLAVVAKLADASDLGSDGKP